MGQTQQKSLTFTYSKYLYANSLFILNYQVVKNLISFSLMLTKKTTFTITILPWKGCSVPMDLFWRIIPCVLYYTTLQMKGNIYIHVVILLLGFFFFKDATIFKEQVVVYLIQIESIHIFLEVVYFKVIFDIL